jgi:hypothetical protein
MAVLLAQFSICNERSISADDLKGSAISRTPFEGMEQIERSDVDLENVMVWRRCRMTMCRWVVVAATALLTACTTPMFTMPPGPEGYRIGYRDGCDAGYAHAGSPFYKRRNVTEPPPGTKD